MVQNCNQRQRMDRINNIISTKWCILSWVNFFKNKVHSLNPACTIINIQLKKPHIDNTMPCAHKTCTKHQKMNVGKK